MLSGSNHYYALDIIEHANTEANLRVFDELVILFANRVNRPTRGWPDFDEYMDGKLFPHHILTPRILERSLHKDRVGAIRQLIQNRAASTDTLSLRYMVPWQDPSVISKGSVDLVLSHSCLEHVDD